MKSDPSLNDIDSELTKLTARVNNLEEEKSNLVRNAKSDIADIVNRLDHKESRESAFENKTESQIDQILSRLEIMEKRESAFETKTEQRIDMVIGQLSQIEKSLNELTVCLVGSVANRGKGLLPEHEVCRQDAEEQKKRLDALETKIAGKEVVSELITRLAKLEEKANQLEMDKVKAIAWVTGVASVLGLIGSYVLDKIFK